MKFNPKLKSELIKYEKNMAAEGGASVAAIRNSNEEFQTSKIRNRTTEAVVGGVINWKPIDRAAAMLVAKAPWWAHPPQVEKPTPEPQNRQPKPKEKIKRMKSAITESVVEFDREHTPKNGHYIAKSGLTIKMVNGEPMFNLEELNAHICEQIEKLPRETRPSVQQAEDARRVIGELLHGIGGEMEKFQANSKAYLDDIRQTRFAVVRECSEMTKELKEVRMFFLGSDYKEQVARLREFVELCERLRQLKTSGFLDCVADTMIRLAEPRNLT